MAPQPRTRRTAAVLVVVLALGLIACDGDPEPGAAPARSDGAAAGPTDDPDEAWRRLPDAPLDGRTRPVVVGVGRQVLVVGGRTDLCPPLADCSLSRDPAFRDGAILDSGAGRWRPIADAPVPVAEARTAVLDEQVYLLLGDGELLRYDLRDDAWERLSPRPRPTPKPVSMVAVPGGVAVVEGSDRFREGPDQRYDAATDTWSALPDDPLPPARNRTAVRDGHRLVVVASPAAGRVGMVASDLDPDLEGDPTIVAALDLRTGQWERLPDGPDGYGVLAVAGEVWRDLWDSERGDGGGVLDLVTDTWRPLPDGGPEPGRIAGVLGQRHAAYEASVGAVRDTRTDSWVPLPALPDRPGLTYDDTVTAVGPALVSVGGQRWRGRDGRLLSEAWVWRPPA